MISLCGVLTYRDSVRVWFRDGSYRWLDAARFTVEGSGTASEVLDALLVHDQYVNRYTVADDVACTAEEAAADAARFANQVKRYDADHPGQRRPRPADAPPPPDRHGPYLLDRIGADGYEPVEGGNGEVIVREWLDREGSFPEDDEYEGGLPKILAIAGRNQPGFCCGISVRRPSTYAASWWRRTSNCSRWIWRSVRPG